VAENIMLLHESFDICFYISWISSSNPISSILSPSSNI